jgi:DNA modification methylase
VTEYKILLGDCRETIRSIPDQSVNTVVTSPPYFGLRDYGTGKWVGGDPNCNHMRDTKVGNATTGHKNMEDKGHAVGDAIYKSECAKCGAVREDAQFGLEETPEDFCDNLVKLFREIRRVLKDDGTVWLNLGDSYAGSGKNRNADGTSNAGDDSKQSTSRGTTDGNLRPVKAQEIGLKPKDLIGIPWMVAFALRADGWYLRQDIIWSKPNPMPESVRDRCTKSHEYIFLLSKSKKYYYDHEAIKVEGSNKRSVWNVVPKSFKGAHFATFPPELIEPCILAGCPEGGTVLDPFGGSGTTAGVAYLHDRNSILCELNPEYAELVERRIEGIIEGKRTLGAVLPI